MNPKHAIGKYNQAVSSLTSLLTALDHTPAEAEGWAEDIIEDVCFVCRSEEVSKVAKEYNGSKYA